MSAPRSLRALVLAAVAGGCGFDGTVLTETSDAASEASVDASSESAPDAVTGPLASLVSAGQIASCALAAGRASCWGANLEGGLGIGSTQQELAPAPVQTAATFSSLVVGDAHACAIEAATRRIDCWGGNDQGQLGMGDAQARSVPAAVGLGQGAVEVSTAYEFTCAIAGSGSLWCWGENDEGQIGQGDAPGAANILAPRQVGVASDWLHVAPGQGHACAIESPGALWCWGRNTSGELGLGAGQPIQIRTPTRVGSDADWSTVDLGQDSACAIKRDGTLWCWGSDASGQLGVPGDPDASASNLPQPTQVGNDADWTEVSIDTFHACALKQSGTLWCWGRNVEGQLGLGDNVDRSAPAEVATGGAGEPSWRLVSVGRFHTCAEATDGTVYCTGKNDGGALGAGDTQNRNVFTPVLLALSP